MVGVFSKVKEGVICQIRLSPNAKKNSVTGVGLVENDGLVLKVSVTAIPEKGKANQALIKLLSKEWKIAKSQFTLINGTTNKNKTLLIEDNSETLYQDLNVWIAKYNE